MSDSSKTRFKKELIPLIESFVNGVEEVSEQWRGKLKGTTTEEGVHDAMISIFLKEDRFNGLVEDMADQYDKEGKAAIMENFRSLWAGLSADQVVATNEGWQFRRALLGAISAPSKTTFKDVREFVGGALSRKAYNQATARRNDTAADQNLHDL